MASQQEYEMMFKLSAQLGQEFGATFKTAQGNLNDTQKQIQALYKQQADISSYQKQQQSVEATTKKLADLQQQYDNIQREIQETEGFSSSLENKLIEKQRAIEKTNEALESQKSKLNNLSNALRESGVDMNNLDGESEKLAAKMNKLAEENANAAKEATNYGDSAAEAFEAAGAALAAAGVMKAMSKLIDLYKEAVTEAHEYADEILTVSTQYRVGTQDLQAFYYAADLVDVSVDTITKSMSKNIASMSKARDGSQQVSEAYAELGVSVANTDGSLRNSETVYWEVIDALGNISNETERDALAQQILGKSAAELTTLIKAGSATMKEYADEAKRTGYVLSDEVLATLHELDDAEKRHQNQIKSLKNEIGAVFAPELTKLKEIETQILGDIQKFIKEHPAMAKALMVLAGEAAALVTVYTSYVAVKKGLNAVKTLSALLTVKDTVATGAHTVATVTQTGATNAATVAQHGLNAAMAANPVGAILVAVSALVPIIVGVVSAISEATKEVEALTEAARNMDEVFAESEKTFENTNAEIYGTAELTEQYIGKLKRLEEQGLKTRTEQREYSLIVERLNSLLPELNAEIDVQTGLLKGGVEYVENYAKAWKEAALQQALATSYQNEMAAWADAEAEVFTNKFKLKENEDQLKEAEATLANLEVRQKQASAAAQKEYNNKGGDRAARQNVYGNDDYYAEYNRLKKIAADYSSAIQSAREKVKKLKDENSALTRAISDGESKVKKAENTLKEAEGALNLFNESMSESTELTENASAAQELFNGTSKELFEVMGELGKTYAETYSAAKKSVEGQYKLWDTAAIVVPKDIEEINNALETQLAYWEDYSKDLETLRAKSGSIEGLSDMIAAELSSGSAESVNMVAGMVNATDEQIAQMVENWRKRNEEQEEVARQYTEIATGFTDELNGMVDEMNSAIEALNLDDEAEAAAKDTVAAYAQAIRDGTADAVAAAEEMSSLVANALANGAGGVPNSVREAQNYIDAHKMTEGDRARWGQDPAFYKLFQTALSEVGTAEQLQSMLHGYKAQAYASGTDYAEPGIALVGEKGPELVMMRGGETVLNAQETRSLYTGQGNNVTITIAPTFTVSGGSDDIEDRLRQFTDEIVDEVKDALEEAGIDAKRGAYV